MEVLISGGLERHRKLGDYVNEASYTRNKTKRIEVVFKERRMYDIIFLVGSDSFVLNIKTFRVINLFCEINISGLSRCSLAGASSCSRQIRKSLGDLSPAVCSNPRSGELCRVLA